MRLRYLMMGLALSTALFTACSDDDDPTGGDTPQPDADPVLDVSETEVSATAEASTYTIDVTATGQWTAMAADAWVETAANGDALQLTVKENLGRDARTTTVTLQSDDNLEQTISLTQEAYAYSEDHHYKLPVVFHVLYWNPNNTQHYVKEGHLQTVLDQVNELYRNCGQDLGFELVPATEDPEGNLLPEPGVHRQEWINATMSVEEFMLINDPENKALLWDTSRYVNIFLFNFSDRLVMGMSQFPYVPEPYALDGIDQVPLGTTIEETPYMQCVSINNRYIYDLPDSETYYSQSNAVVTVAHELGHFLGLYHAFNQTDTSNNVNYDTDYCTDTPPYNKALYDTALRNYLSAGNNITDITDPAYERFVMRTNSETREQFRSTNVMDYAITDGDEITPQQAERVRYILRHGLFIPGPKDYSQADVTMTRSAADVTFELKPRIVE